MLWSGDVLLLRRPRAPVQTQSSRRSPQGPRAADGDKPPDLQHHHGVGPVTLPRITRSFPHHAQRVEPVDRRGVQLFSLSDFLLDESSAASPESLRNTVLSRHNYRKLLHLFLSELHRGGQSTVANHTLGCHDLPPITHRVPKRQIICELSVVVQMEARARDPFRSGSGDGSERRAEHTHYEPFAAHELLLSTVTSRLFQGSRRSGSPFRSTGECEIISVSELAVLDCVTRGGTRLSLKAHFISDLPDVLCLSDRLTYLNVSFNSLTLLPQQVCELKQLQVLKMRSNPIEELPANISRLNNLQTLVLSFCKISQLPTQLFSLPCLQFLDVSYNLLKSLSSDIRNLRSLRSLNVEGNQLVALPAALLCVSVSELRLSGNYTHPLLWSDNSCNSPQTLLHTAAHTLAQQRHTHLTPVAQTILTSAGVCDACSGPMFGPGLKLICPVPGVCGLQLVPFMFMCCSPSCLRTFKNQGAGV